MPKFIVTVAREVIETVEVSIDAENEESAQEGALALEKVKPFKWVRPCEYIAPYVQECEKVNQ
jgi:hypothetical protein